VQLKEGTCARHLGRCVRLDLLVDSMADGAGRRGLLRRA
jgi:hypothetical protein